MDQWEWRVFKKGDGMQMAACVKCLHLANSYLPINLESWETVKPIRHDRKKEKERWMKGKEKVGSRWQRYSRRGEEDIGADCPEGYLTMILSHIINHIIHILSNPGKILNVLETFFVLNFPQWPLIHSYFHNHSYLKAIQKDWSIWSISPRAVLYPISSSIWLHV